MKLLVTGGAGYIGSYITKYFSKMDEIEEITSLDNLFFNQNFFNQSPKIKNIKGDVRDKILMKSLYNKHDIIIPLAVGFGVGLMIILNVTHPPAGGNPIIVIIGSVSIDYLINPIIIGSMIILLFGVVLNRLILKKKYPS